MKKLKIAINGAGIAGPTLAWWLKKYGHEPVLFEIAPKLRTGGYVIDFWGVGYDVADRMGILPMMQKDSYIVEQLKVLDQNGKVKARANLEPMIKMLNDRYLSITRGDLASAIFKACSGVESRFGVSVTGLKEEKDKVNVTLSDGSEEAFDLVVGADGLHSKVRELAFGSEQDFEHPLGFYVAAFELDNYKHRDELTYIMHRAPQRSVGRFSMKDDKTLFLFIFRSDLIDQQPTTEEDEKATVRKVFADIKWEVPDILERMSEVKDIYFDRVSQIRASHWTKGRIALVGDAAACVSLLAGEGSGLAMIEAYVLAGELHKAKGDHEVAFANYEKMLQPFLIEKQKASLRSASFFAPKGWLGLMLGNIGVRFSNSPFFLKRFLSTQISDDIKLLDYKIDKKQ